MLSIVQCATWACTLRGDFIFATCLANSRYDATPLWVQVKFLDFLIVLVLRLTPADTPFGAGIGAGAGGGARGRVGQAIVGFSTSVTLDDRSIVTGGATGVESTGVVEVLVVVLSVGSRGCCILVVV